MSDAGKVGILVLGLLLLTATVAHGEATITVVNQDDPGEGFNDMTAVAAVTGNPATTLGQQRLNVFQAAADAWGAIVDSDAEILVEANIDPLFCDATSAVLGAATAISVFRDFDSAPRPATWYPVALASALSGEDLDPGGADVFARFNGDLDTDPDCVTGIVWWYGIGAPAPANTLDFFRVVLHEIGHGLGFASFVNPSNGERFFGFDDDFMVHLEDHSLGKTWGQMTDNERLNSAIDSSDLHWTGPNAVADAGPLVGGVHPSGHIQMYAPSPLELGSSVSHWDSALIPNELMEPFLLNDGANIVTTGLLEDLGWPVEGGGGPGPGPDCTPNNNTLCLNGDRFKVEVTWTDFEGGSGPGVVVPFGSDDSGLFWFFSPDNWEMLVKVLTGCEINDHYWVFAAATTNVEYTLKVTDTQTRAEAIYTNPLGVSSPAITDTSAFATCP